jgi:membrane-bound lytic murein transglycosylase B
MPPRKDKVTQSDGDGRRDIWDAPADIFASIANYLKKHGWVRSRGWGREVIVPRGRDMIVPPTEPAGRHASAEQYECSGPAFFFWDLEMKAP